MNKKIIALGIIAAMVVSVFCLTGCKKKDFKTEGEMLVVTEATFPPFDTVDDAGNIVGFDMDLMEAIAEDQGFTVKFKDIGFDSLIPALEANEADIIAAGMNSIGKTGKARAKKIDFSDPYFESQLVLLVKADNSTVTGVADLTSDMKVAGQTGTTGADEVTALAEDGKIAEAVVLDKVSDMMLQLQNGDIQAVILDKPVAESYIAKQAGIAKIVGDPIGEKEAYAIGVQKGNTVLLDKINAGLKNLKENGTYDALVAKWF